MDIQSLQAIFLSLKKPFRDFYKSLFFCQKNVKVFGTIFTRCIKFDMIKKNNRGGK